MGRLLKSALAANPFLKVRFVLVLDFSVSRSLDSVGRPHFVFAAAALNYPQTVFKLAGVLMQADNAPRAHWPACQVFEAGAHAQSNRDCRLWMN
jgi:hypothetical protein